jgi:hypothetical protein
VDGAFDHAAHLAVSGAHTEAARVVDEALTAAPVGNVGWLLPVEPLLHVSAHLDVWAGALAHLRNRAA